MRFERGAAGPALLLIVALVACGDDDGEDTDGAEVTPTPVHWAYEGEAGPAQWGDLSPDFAACEDGQEQSPVELASAAPQDLPDIDFSYEPSSLAIQNNGHTIQVDYQEGSSISVGNEEYELVQFHFHARGEHTIGGETFPLEMHLVHRGTSGDLAVVGVLLESGAANAAFDAVFDNLPAEESEAATIEDASVDAAQMLPLNRSYFTYAGSLTTPPCSEGVAWFVLREPVEVSEPQIARFTAIFANNYRPTQPLGDREILLYQD